MKRYRKTVGILQLSEDLPATTIANWCIQQRVNILLIRPFAVPNRFPSPYDIDALVITGKESTMDDEPLSPLLSVFLERVLEKHIPCVGLNFGADILYHALEGEWPRLYTPVCDWLDISLNSEAWPFSTSEDQAMTHQRVYFNRNRATPVPEDAQSLGQSTDGWQLGFHLANATAIYAMPDITPSAWTTLNSRGVSNQSLSGISDGKSKTLARTTNENTLLCAVLKGALKSKKFRAGVAY
ncbi:MAG: hypothetical protein KDC12_08015 [Flavobacteriales bacterium]|nr:hypothetical protein [Flavobacteriales bacterium]